MGSDLSFVAEGLELLAYQGFSGARWGHGPGLSQMRRLAERCPWLTAVGWPVTL